MSAGENFWASAHAKERMLVIDDSLENANSLVRLLKFLGYNVEAAYSGEEGISIAATFLPDMVFIDIGMPGIDGYETARRIKKHPECLHSILVALTGYTQPDGKRRAYEAGFDLHVSKPLGLDMLKELLSILDPDSPDKAFSQRAKLSTKSQTAVSAS